MLKRHRLIMVLSLLVWVSIAGWISRQQYHSRLHAIIRDKSAEGMNEARSFARHIENTMDKFNDIPPLLAQEPVVLATFANAMAQPAGRGAALVGATDLNGYLARIKRALGPREVWVMNARGICVGASNSGETNSFVGADFSDRDYFQQARLAHPGPQYSFGRRTHVPGLFFSAPVLRQGTVLGVVTVKMNMDALTNWMEVPDGFLVDEYGVVIFANNPALALKAFPGARIQSTPVAERRRRYDRDGFPTLSMVPWRDTNSANFIIFDKESSPQLLFSEALPRENLRVYVPEPFPALPGLADDCLWHFVLMATAGGSLILLLGASLQYSGYYRQANRTLVSQKNLLMDAERIARLGSWTCDFATGSLELSEHAAEILGVERQTAGLTSALFVERAGPSDQGRVKGAFDLAIREGRPCNLEFSLAEPSAHMTIVHLQGRLVYDRNSRPVRMVGTLQDITARKEVERKLTQMVSLLRATLESTADGILVVSRDAKISSYNERFLKMWQLPGDLVSSGEDDVVLAAVVGQMKNPEAFETKVQQLYESPLTESFDLLELRDGRIFERYSKPQLIDGQAVGRVWSFYDVTEQKRAEASVLETDRRLRILIEATKDFIFLKDGEGRWQLINEAARLAYSLGEIDYQGKTERDLAKLIPWRRTEFEYSRNSDARAWQNRQPARAEEYLAGDDGTLRCYDVIKVPIYNDDGSRQGLVVVGRDITERKRTEEELFQSRETLQMVLNNIPHLVFWKNRDLVFEGCNLPMARDRGLAHPAELTGKTDFDIATVPDAENFRAVDLEVMAANQPRLNFEQIQVRADGSTAYFLVNKIPLHDKQGQVVGVLGVCENITERKILEAQVRQAHKMESIGRLAGGVAHDFNNLLTVICGYCEILLDETPREDPAHDSLNEIKKAGDRAAALTRQLLAFSRKQILEPAVMDINNVLDDYAKMFRRLLGENIELHLKLSPELGQIKADASHIDQVFLNLVVNARDAMPTGGKLFIETSNVSLDGLQSQRLEEVAPGNYVCLTVRDTGCGMDEQTMAHIFEPFFTTKELGKGTGLGLAMIFGFIKQSGGHVVVNSEVNAGTTFKIYLPEFREGMAAKPKFA